ncbi:hypothetical protein F5Y16DRAFT_381188 [Xylariaceae sp. FL0255]|nr:hypothetical protein F5Y16DRAFT_381188 [Xylariaceae sp. FL0255]
MGETLKILIIGAGVCGPALATLLRNAEETPTEITIIDRSPSLRTGGQQIDFRAQGIPILRKMGLLNAMRSRAVPETGIAMVDRTGKVRAAFPMTEKGENEDKQSLTSEYELMRGDIVEVFYRASLGLDVNVKGGEECEKKVGESQSKASKVRYEFGISVTSLINTEDGSAVEVTFADGRTLSYDLVIGADGQGSRTRAAVMGSEEASKACFRTLNLFTAFYNIPRRSDDLDMALAYALARRRSVLLRAANKDRPAQVYLSFMPSKAADKKKKQQANAVEDEKRKDSGLSIDDKEKELDGIRPGESDYDYFHRVLGGRSTEAQKQLFVSKFADTDAWRVPEFTSYLKPKTEDSSSSSDFDTDFYATEIGQVHCPKLSNGRIVLLGDAGYTPSPITGMGTTLSLTGAWILAGELSSKENRASKSGGVDVLDALRAYETKVRPYIKKGQELPPGTPGIIYPESAWAIWLIAALVWISSKMSPVLMFLLQFVPSFGKPMVVPEYPELRLGD